MNKNSQDQFAKIYPTWEKALKKERCSRFDKTSYVTAYYPTKDGQAVEIIKDKIPRRPSASWIR